MAIYSEKPHNPLGSRKTLATAAGEVTYFDMNTVGDVDRLPFSIKVLLEAALRNMDGFEVTEENVRGLAAWSPTAEATEVPFKPARVILQDFTGVPCVVDLAAMRSAMKRAGGDPQKINPLVPVDLVIDHSVQVDEFANPLAMIRNSEIEFDRNRERYEFLKWGQKAFKNFGVVPPATGIVHQVNLEYLAGVVLTQDGVAMPDSLVGTDSHTTMINGLGVLGWGVGGIEAEAAMLGQPCYLLTPEVVGMKLTGELPEGATATDLVLRVTEILRTHGVVGKFVEFFGPGMKSMTVADRGTIANMAPEYGATMGFFPVDEKTLDYMRLTGRDDKQIDLVERYTKANGLWCEASSEPVFTETLELDLGTITPSIAGPRRPQDRIELRQSRSSFRSVLMDDFGQNLDGQIPRLDRWSNEAPLHEDGSHAGEADAQAADAISHLESGNGPAGGSGDAHEASPSFIGEAAQAVAEKVAEVGGAVKMALAPKATGKLQHGDVVIAAITSCTNTSNPSVMVAAGLVAKKANERGLSVPHWVKTSLAPGSRVVTDYLDKSNLSSELDQLGFHTVGYGCTTCIGNSGPLPEHIAKEIQDNDLVACSVLSGNRNFEGRINPHVKANYLASPPLVVAYALAGSMDVDLSSEPIQHDANGQPVYLKDIWPTQEEVSSTVASCIDPSMFRDRYGNVAEGNEDWNAIPVKGGELFDWSEDSTYVQEPPFFVGLGDTPEPITAIHGAKVLVMVGDSVTTDHISPAGAIKATAPAGKYLKEKGVGLAEFNSYGARRGNDRVMVRGTFANIRLKNQLAPGTEGGWTTFQGDTLPADVIKHENGQAVSIFDASRGYGVASTSDADVNPSADGTPLVVLAGKDYGMGSSRDWAAKGTLLLGVKAVIAESFERIHRSNLVGMGVLPLTFNDGDTRDSLGLDGTETFDITVDDTLTPRQMVPVTATKSDGTKVSFEALCRIDTPVEIDYYRNGGILQTVLRRLMKS
ncbi:MAG: aconitate hydratase [Planctomycetota bacterium]